MNMKCLITAAVLAACVAQGGGPSYDPLRVANTGGVRTLRLDVHDIARIRDLPVRVYLPAATNPAPVVLFSHGLGGSCENNPYLGNHWAARGYAAVFMQPPGSDEALWNNAPTVSEKLGKWNTDMPRAANFRNLKLRAEDVAAVLDTLEKWSREPRHALAGRLDMARVGMSGHSFGAATTQAVCGQRFPPGLLNAADPRIKAAVMFSPNAPKWGGDAGQAFGEVKIPWLLMTGTKDLALFNRTDVESRLRVFPALPPGGKYELVLDGAEHSAFGDRALPGDKEKRNPNHHRAVLALSTAFWDAWLRGDERARAWLDGDGPRTVLEKGDRWQKK
jgi:predicted dienelactone hydrolase